MMRTADVIRKTKRKKYNLEDSGSETTIDNFYS